MVFRNTKLVAAGVSPIWCFETENFYSARNQRACMLRTDGKRPDGLTLIPWQNGRPIVWDATVVNTLAESYLSLYSSPAAAAESAADRKQTKHPNLPESFIFQPVAFETLGPINMSAIEFLDEVGRRLEVMSGDARERTYLYHRLSVCVQHFNAAAFRGSFGSFSPDMDT